MSGATRLIARGRQHQAGIINQGRDITMTNRHGGCLCGAIRYEIKSEPVLVAVCHCKNCQKQSGGMYSTNLGVPEADYVQTGETKIFHDKGDSGKYVDRYFCANCGSPILSRAEAIPGMVLIKAGTLDNLAGTAPKLEIFTDSAADWVPPVPGAQRFARGMG
jgi:hypothetical protein